MAAMDVPNEKEETDTQEEESISSLWQRVWNKFQGFVKDHAQYIKDETTRNIVLAALNKDADLALVTIAVKFNKDIRKEIMQGDVIALQKRLPEAVPISPDDFPAEVRERALIFGRVFVQVLDKIEQQ